MSRRILLNWVLPLLGLALLGLLWWQGGIQVFLRNLNYALC